VTTPAAHPQRDSAIERVGAALFFVVAIVALVLLARRDRDDVPVALSAPEAPTDATASPAPGDATRAGTAPEVALAARAVPAMTVPVVRRAPSSSEPAPATVAEDALPGYRPTAALRGTLRWVGSDSMANLLEFWGEDFSGHHPEVEVVGQAKGSQSAPPALIAGTADVGPMSREMKPAEMDAFQAAFGYPPTEIRVAYHALAVVVNHENSVRSMTFEQLRAVYGVAVRDDQPGRRRGRASA
jgi:hypothetical protein